MKSTWFNSLCFKLLRAYVLGTLLAITVAAACLGWLASDHSDWLAGRDLVDFTEEVTKSLQFDEQHLPIGFHDDGEDLNWVFNSLSKETAFRVLDSAGHTVLTSAAGAEFWKSDTASHQPLSPFEFTTEGQLFHSAIASTTHNNDVWYVQFAVSSRFFYLLYKGFAFPFMGVGILIFSIVLLLILAMLAAITLSYTLKPLHRLSESAIAISPRSLTTRLPVQGMPSEIAPLVDSFNRVLDRIEKGYHIQKEFMTTAAHELKTPLALIRAQIEILPVSSARDALLGDIAHMTRHVQQLLMLAEVSEQQNYTITKVDMHNIACEVASFLKPIAEKADVTIQVSCEHHVNWYADPSATFILLKNLVENAIQHAPRATEVRLTIGASQISVRDWGPGIDEEQLEQIFLRFWRGPHRRDYGAGLGLNICKEIARAHGWEIKVRNANPGLYFYVQHSNN